MNSSKNRSSYEPNGLFRDTLDKKAWFKPGDSLYVEDTPAWYSDLMAENNVEITLDLPATHAHIFCDSKASLNDFLKNVALDNIEHSVWVSWLKKSAGIKTDLTEQDFRDAILPLGWVDTKVAAVDDSWSGLKFVRRKS